jgi:hypothetical protein
MRPAVVERDPRADDEVFYRPGCQDLAGRGQPSDTRADVDGETRDLFLTALDLARVHTGANLQPEASHAVADRASAAERTSWTVEASEDAIPCEVDLAAAKPLELAPHQTVMPLEQVVPLTIAELGGALR